MESPVLKPHLADLVGFAFDRTWLHMITVPLSAGPATQDPWSCVSRRSHGGEEELQPDIVVLRCLMHSLLAQIAYRLDPYLINVL